MTTQIPLWVLILSSLGFPVIVTAGFNFISKVVENRHNKKKADAEREAERESKADERELEQGQRDTETFNTTRASVEAHIRWDYMLMSRVEALQESSNELRVKLGMEPIVYSAIPEPPPFFTRPSSPASGS